MTSESTKESTSSNTGAGVQPTAIEVLKQLTDERERSSKQLAEIKAESERLAALRTEAILGGQTNAGQVPIAKKEISDLEYARAALQGKILK